MRLQAHAVIIHPSARAFGYKKIKAMSPHVKRIIAKEFLIFVSIIAITGMVSVFAYGFNCYRNSSVSKNIVVSLPPTPVEIKKMNPFEVADMEFEAKKSSNDNYKPITNIDITKVALLAFLTLTTLAYIVRGFISMIIWSLKIMKEPISFTERT